MNIASLKLSILTYGRTAKIRLSISKSNVTILLIRMLVAEKEKQARLREIMATIYPTS
ncbi:hypothetical protein HCA55_13820 [Listeria booriae]|uniref:Uncharacterized protein n=1 Tax=Listeria booriae TaxID=1552123 RepID=A0A7X0YWM6_9LIST|nr:hypothetical protein [Listeria booriae]MBC1792740.1 hypothetical protein [Listeria booriae]MBC1797813.1 hypothetical protein [Listeria booriae]MBC1804735.1 hypothetical protein [Listeria booriae]MBC1811628.1 hypothetical protein [Listeria booriae]MBC2149397.1 hypothetical protein [Listeria booriae]